MTTQAKVRWAALVFVALFIAAYFVCCGIEVSR